MKKISISSFRDISFLSPEENILFDDVLLSLAEQGECPDTLRLWESPSYFVVLGRTGKLEEDVQLEQIAQQPIPVLRRSSGGGTVLQGPGCLNFSFILSKDQTPALADIRGSYRLILEHIISFLHTLDIQTEFRPISDLVFPEGERKFSGNAQRRGRKFILHHGTLLYRFDLDKISLYLRMPKDVPEYRQGRGHAQFVANIPAGGKVPGQANNLKMLLFRHLGLVGDPRVDVLPEEEVLLDQYVTRFKPVMGSTQ